jgi:hypothetical protein
MPAGRPQIDFDLNIVRKLGVLGCTAAEMASFLGCSERTIDARMADKDGEFCAAFKKGLVVTKMSLRRKQLQLALDGNVTMLIWLGKQLLGQQNRFEMGTPGLDGREEVRFTIYASPGDAESTGNGHSDRSFQP